MGGAAEVVGAGASVVEGVEGGVAGLVRRDPVGFIKEPGIGSGVEGILGDGAIEAANTASEGGESGRSVVKIKGNLIFVCQQSTHDVSAFKRCQYLHSLLLIVQVLLLQCFDGVFDGTLGVLVVLIVAEWGAQLVRHVRVDDLVDGGGEGGTSVEKSELLRSNPWDVIINRKGE